MIGRIVEVSDDRRHLFLSRGFMVVQDTEGSRKELGQVPLDDIAAVIANAHGLSYTNNLLVALAERCAPFVLCAANHNPVGMLLTVNGNYQQAKRFDAQLAASQPLLKRLWAEIVKSKLRQQAAPLEATGAPDVPLSALVRKVRSGDPDNFEAQGARRYWGLLFGNEFRRDQQAGGTNAMLNYGYTTLRAATARAVVAAGLHPTLGLHHSNQGNAMRLVDDLMEPFRPVIDLKVWQLRKQGESVVTSDNKRALVRTLYDDMQTSAGATPVMVCAQKLAVSLAQIFMGEQDKLDLPLPGLATKHGRSLARCLTRMLSGYRFMWIVVMFDLPVVEKRERKAAMEFRNALLDMGFEMCQYSVYMRFCSSQSQVDTYCIQIEKSLPGGGKVNILQFTDKQYECIITFRGKAKQAPKQSPDQYDLF